MDPDSRPRSGASGALARQALRVSVTDGRGRPLRDGGLARWLGTIAPRTALGELGVALVSDARMRVLNRSYRGKDYVTDVLSFAADGAPVRRRAPRTSHPATRAPHSAPRTPHFAPRPLGDIVIATGVAARQARGAGHSYQTELRVLALHGLLHLLGYDHESRRDQGRMARAEARLRRKGGLGAGLIARSKDR